MAQSVHGYLVVDEYFRPGSVGVMTEFRCVYTCIYYIIRCNHVLLIGSVLRHWDRAIIN